MKNILMGHISTCTPRLVQILQMMKDAGVTPNTMCMNSLMAVNVQAKQPNTALEIFKEMERDGVPRDVVRIIVASFVFFAATFDVVAVTKESAFYFIVSFPM